MIAEIRWANRDHTLYQVTDGAGQVEYQPLDSVTSQGETIASFLEAGNDVRPYLTTGADVNLERDRRIRGGFDFAGVPFDYDDASQRRITGAATLAGFAAGAGAPAGYLRWHGGDDDFVWIAADNTTMPMDAPTCFSFGQAAAAWESAHIFAAKALKDAGVPDDYLDDLYWPVR